MNPLLQAVQDQQFTRCRQAVARYYSGTPLLPRAAWAPLDFLSEALGVVLARADAGDEAGLAAAATQVGRRDGPARGTGSRGDPSWLLSL
jgi:hypothetical protein